MHSYRAPVLTLCMLALAACQPSQAPAQTQSAQSAFDTAVAAAATQAAPPLPTAMPALTATFAPDATEPPQPLTTLEPALLKGAESELQRYLDKAVVGYYHPDDPASYDVRIVAVTLQYYDEGRAAVLDVALQKGDLTDDTLVGVRTLKALAAIYSAGEDFPGDPALDYAALGAGLLVPRQLRTFRIHMFDADQQERFRVSGDWADVVAYGKGSLSSDDFTARLKFEQAAE